MNKEKHPPGTVRDAIVAFLETQSGDASVADIQSSVEDMLGEVPKSSVRSYLRLKPDTFARTERGRYQLINGHQTTKTVRKKKSKPIFVNGTASLYQSDCFKWLAERSDSSIHAVVTDPPYGLVEYTQKEQKKMRNGSGGVWRIPPSFDGHQRSPLPRFTTLSPSDLEYIHKFFFLLGTELTRVLVPGAHIFIASNPLVSHIVASALDKSGLEPRGTITRLVMTMRGGDRPKNAHDEFPDVSVMPRSMAEPWVLFRNPLEGRVQDNLRKWYTGGLRRLSERQPFGDVIKSHPTRREERNLAPHPSLKPQSFMRQIVKASLPLEKGIILDPFAGSGSTLAASNYFNYESIGVEMDPKYIDMAKSAIPLLGKFSYSGKPS